MTTWVGWFCFCVLGATAALHAYWALGGLWPAAAEPDLVKTVIGADHDRMPAAGLTLLVAFLIFTAGVFAFARGVLDWDSRLFLRIPLAGLAAIFLLRGTASYLPGPFARSVEPFATLNALYFSPLILLLGLGFAYLALAPRS
ncbi:DUF3995 domain-containing protein [Maricaulis sp.]|uniref:DUF3995 domain-containing protein n=1 Tax=Maricaulis sp. TaxID=1486257 RepID=UPI00261C7870|nr:DUF3995 domain-containing protein [Maricaulis sp.]